MSDHAFSLGSMVRFHELRSPQDPTTTLTAFLTALEAQGFTIDPGTYADGHRMLRFGEIGDDSASNWTGLLLEVIPLASLLGARRRFARCAVPAVVEADGSGSRLLTGTVWGFRGEAGTVGLVAKRVSAAARSAAAAVGGTLDSRVTPIDKDAPFTLKRFDQLTGWKNRPKPGSR
jgi:hypothetical protein